MAIIIDVGIPPPLKKTMSFEHVRFLIPGGSGEVLDLM